MRFFVAPGSMLLIMLDYCMFFCIDLCNQEHHMCLNWIDVLGREALF